MMLISSRAADCLVDYTSLKKSIWWRRLLTRRPLNAFTDVTSVVVKTFLKKTRDQDQDLGSLVSRPRLEYTVYILFITFAQNSTIKFHFKCNKCIHTHSRLAAHSVVQFNAHQIPYSILH